MYSVPPLAISKYRPLTPRTCRPLAAVIVALSRRSRPPDGKFTRHNSRLPLLLPTLPKRSAFSSESYHDSPIADQEFRSEATSIRLCRKATEKRIMAELQSLQHNHIANGVKYKACGKDPAVPKAKVDYLAVTQRYRP